MDELEDEDNGIDAHELSTEEEEEAVNDDFREDDNDGNAGAMLGSGEVNDQSFEELHLPASTIEATVESWGVFVEAVGSKDVAGEVIFAAIFDAAPSLQGLFKTPRAVMTMRFVQALHQIILNLSEPKALKIIVETLAFQHLDFDVTVQRVGLFRDAIVDLLSNELGERFSVLARSGWSTILGYVGGAYIFCRTKLASRLKILASSWAAANHKKDGLGKEEESRDETATTSDSQAPGDLAQGRAKKTASSGEANKSGEHSFKKKGRLNKMENWEMENANVPTTFDEMFVFNAAVMGFSGCIWMNEILESFDTIVSNVSNTGRLQEECDVLTLRLAFYKGSIHLQEFKAVMLSSLRSLVPAAWNSDHEVAWCWLWENLERMLASQTGLRHLQQCSLDRLWNGLGKDERSGLRTEVYSKFFGLAPAGQEFFKQSTTRLHWIADRVLAMTLEIYRRPKEMVEEISATGLRHVGYGVPTDLFSPYVSACVMAVKQITHDETVIEAFRWSLSLISRILTRVITEGSTIVMKAINTNSAAQLRKAVACAPRGERAKWVLNIQVGTQSISPLIWAIEAGSLEAAKAIIVDLLTIRADRDRYYYGMNALFDHHPDIVRRLAMEVPALLTTLLDGLIWRSRTTKNGLRRVNYFVRYLIEDAEGNFSKAIGWITETEDPKMMCHPVVALVTDTVWGQVAYISFLQSKIWFLTSLVIFIFAQDILKRLGDLRETTDEEGNTFYVNNLTLTVRASKAAFRLFIYIVSMSTLIYRHCRLCIQDFRNKRMVRIFFGRIPLPAYLSKWQEAASFLLALTLFLSMLVEPIWPCLRHQEEDRVLSEYCFESSNHLVPYSILCAIAVLLYFLLLMDLSVFSTGVSAYMLVCTRVVSEVSLFIFALIFFVLAFACAVSTLEHHDPAYIDIPSAVMQLLELPFGFGGKQDSLQQFPALAIFLFLYLGVTMILLLNMLIAQLSCAYNSTYQDMMGYARLNRGRIVTEAMPNVSKRRWEEFRQSLRLDQCVEFGEGDIGVAGGIQILEPGSAHITTVDMIQRFGGSTSSAAQWPEEQLANADGEIDRLQKVEKMMEKMMKRMGAHKSGSQTGSQAASVMNSSLSETESDERLFQQQVST